MSSRKKIIQPVVEELPWEFETTKPEVVNRPLSHLLDRLKVVVMMKDGKIFRVLSGNPIDLEVLEFDDESDSEEYADYLDHLEMTLPNQVLFHEK